MVTEFFQIITVAGDSSLTGLITVKRQSPGHRTHSKFILRSITTNLSYYGRVFVFTIEVLSWMDCDCSSGSMNVIMNITYFQLFTDHKYTLQIEQELMSLTHGKFIVLHRTLASLTSQPSQHTVPTKGCMALTTPFALLPLPVSPNTNSSYLSKPILNQINKQFDMWFKDIVTNLFKIQL